MPFPLLTAAHDQVMEGFNSNIFYVIRAAAD